MEQHDMQGDRGDMEAAMERIVAYSRDVFFRMRMRTIVRQLGYQITLESSESMAIESLGEPTPVLAIVDFNQPVDWTALEPLVQGSVPVLAFGSHTDVEGFRAAKAADVDRVVSNGEFSRRLPELIDQYRTRA